MMLASLAPPRSLSDIHLPTGVTALLRASFSVSEAIFDVNSINCAEVGAIAWNGSGGAHGGAYVSGLDSAAHAYRINSPVFVGSSTAADWITAWAWLQSAETAAAINSWGPKVLLFGDDAGTCALQLGLSDGKLHMASYTARQGTALVADGAWHLVCFQQISQHGWNCWVDGVKDVSNAIAGWTVGNRYLRMIGSGAYVPTAIAPAALDGVQIWQGEISDAQVQETFAAAGF